MTKLSLEYRQYPAHHAAHSCRTTSHHSSDRLAEQGTATTQRDQYTRRPIGNEQAGKGKDEPRPHAEHNEKATSYAASWTCKWQVPQAPTLPYIDTLILTRRTLVCARNLGSLVVNKALLQDRIKGTGGYSSRVLGALVATIKSPPAPPPSLLGPGSYWRMAATAIARGGKLQSWLAVHLFAPRPDLSCRRTSGRSPGMG
jgi:hypothetical protein